MSSGSGVVWARTRRVHLLLAVVLPLLVVTASAQCKQALLSLSHLVQNCLYTFTAAQLDIASISASFALQSLLLLCSYVGLI